MNHNVVFILADDMRADDLRYMPKTKKLLGDEGLTFDNAFTTHSVCCPSRASFLRGQYSHNHGVNKNFWDGRTHTGFSWFTKLGLDRSTVATWVGEVGYKTFFAGKYLNGYTERTGSYVPPGWDEWHGRLIGYWNDNGRVSQEPEGANPEAELSKRVEEFINEAEEPFLAYMGTRGPHADSGDYSFVKHAGKNYDEVGAPVNRLSYGEHDRTDKPHWVRARKFTDEARGKADEIARNRAKALWLMDEMVVEVLRALENRGILDNTYVFFSSDHGYKLGEHGLRGKGAAYEEDVRIPFLVRGPGIMKGSMRKQMVLNNDFAPTVAELAGAEIPDWVDGTSFAPLLSPGENPDWRKRFYLSHPYRKSGVPPYHALRTQRFTYVTYPKTKEQELYNLQKDPYQLESVHEAKNQERRQAKQRRIARLDSHISAFKRSSGRDCQKTEGL